MHLLSLNDKSKQVVTECGAQLDMHLHYMNLRINQSPQETTFKRKGFVNSDGVSSNANSAIQCL